MKPVRVLVEISCINTLGFPTTVANVLVSEVCSERFRRARHGKKGRPGENSEEMFESKETCGQRVDGLQGVRVWSDWVGRVPGVSPQTERERYMSDSGLYPTRAELRSMGSFRGGGCAACQLDAWLCLSQTGLAIKLI